MTTILVENCSQQSYRGAPRGCCRWRMDAPESMSNPMQQLASVFVEQRPALLRFVRRRLDDHALAEDLVQETWVRASSSDLSAVGNVREIGRAVQQECRDRSRMPSSA
eukprot:TRINITY_DN105087_c0_g1_i1.p1 TRINITY_DN105087_c0_g1~~TRINITY_DN105087_c0_g1_i1.p1  ORF type:complete len:108 (+),score=21.83 TRINITY_DN105087_c0_g1_i1:94-417(+)